MRSKFIPAAAAVTLTLAQAAAPVWSEPAPDITSTVRDDARTAGHAIADSARSVARTVHDGFLRLKAGFAVKSGEPAPKS
jgi:hypothetical protein